MKTGNSIRIKQGITSPDYDDLIIEGWEGRIIDIDDGIVTIELDSKTLSELSENYIIDSIVQNVQYTLISLEMDEIEVVIPRDTKNDVLLKQDELDIRYSSGKEKNRIAKILNSKDNFVNKDNLQKYYQYLKSNIQTPCILTGMEDFDWEEPYVFGEWSEKEYEKLKLTNPSYTDKFEFIEFIDEIDDWKGIRVKVKRLLDKKLFDLPLWDLKTVDENSSNYLLVSDYSSWMTNYK